VNEEQGRIDSALPVGYEATIARLAKLEGRLEAIREAKDACLREWERLVEVERGIIAEHSAVTRRWNYRGLAPGE
jgi:hypothetical protein